jgi:hypothetical protein
MSLDNERKHRMMLIERSHEETGNHIWTWPMPNL